MKKRTLTTVLIVIAMILAACGGGDDNDNDNTDASATTDDTSAETVDTAQESDTTEEDTQITADEDNTDESTAVTDAQSIATITGELIAPVDAGGLETFALNNTVELVATVEYLNTSRNNVHRFSLDFEPADGNGFFFENNRFRLSGGEFSYDYAGEDTLTYTYPEDRDEAFFSYSLSTVTNRQASYEASDWDAVTGTVTLTPNGMTISGEINLTIPTESSDTDEPSGEITLNIILNDVEIENPDAYQEALDVIERQVMLRQAQAEAVDLTISGAFDLSIPPAEVLYSERYTLNISEPDVVMIQMKFGRNIEPGTYTPEDDCQTFNPINFCITITQFQPDGNYDEFTENLGGEIVIESVVPLRATVNITAEDMAGNAITLSGELTDVPYPFE